MFHISISLKTTSRWVLLMRQHPQKMLGEVNHPSHVSRLFARPVYRFRHLNSGSQKTLKVSFSSCFPTRKCWIAISDFTIYLIISKFLIRQKCRQKRKTKTKGRWSEGRNYPQKCFHSSNYVIDLANVYFFFLISLLTRSHLLNDVLSLHCVIWFLPDYLLHLFSSDSFIALTSM